MAELQFKKVIEILGRPSYQSDSVAIYNMDCIEGMRKLPANSIHLTVTSPPYNIGKEYEKIARIHDYIQWCEQWLAKIYNVTVENGAFWLNVGYVEVAHKGLAVPIPYLLWDKTDFYMIQEVIWNYGAGVACRKRLSPRNEKLLWYVKDPKKYTFHLDPIRDPDVKYPNQKKNGKLKCNPLGKNPSDVWRIAKVTSGKNRASKERTPHPAQFPRELIDRVIQACSNKGEIILDPFMGSGTTAESAVKNERYVIGFEVEKKYIQLAASRLAKFIHNEKLRKANRKLPFAEKVLPVDRSEISGLSSHYGQAIRNESLKYPVDYFVLRTFQSLQLSNSRLCLFCPP